MSTAPVKIRDWFRRTLDLSEPPDLRHNLMITVWVRWFVTVAGLEIWPESGGSRASGYTWSQQA